MNTSHSADTLDNHDLLFTTSASKESSSEISGLVMASIAALPTDEQRAFQMAWERSANLVMVESNPELFYRTENGRPDAAAARLARYWTLRTTVLGDRAFRPMLDMTDSGALTVQDKELLQTGVFAPYFFDRKQRTVIVMDSTRVDSALAHSFRERRRHLQLWMFTFAAAHNSRCQNEGVRLLEVVESVSGVNQHEIKGYVDALDLDAFPLKLFDVHFVTVSSSGAEELAMFDSPMVHVISAPDLVQTRITLQHNGFYVESLPMTIGGLWMYEEFRDWFARRVETHGNKGQVDLPSELAVLYDICVRIYPPNTVEQIHAVLIEMIGLPEEEQAAFHEALLAVPEIVATETNPSLFLRVESGNAASAAQRLAGNWKLRKIFFGPRYLRPMLDITGQGALSRDDVTVLETGLYINFLVDRLGQPVGVGDFTRVPACLTTKDVADSRPRLAFWAFTQGSLFTPLAQSVGVRFFRLVNSDPSASRSFFHFTRLYMVLVLPVKLLDWIFVAIPPPGAKALYMETILPLIQAAINKGTENVKEQTECYDKMGVIMGDDTNTLRTELINRGFNLDQLPAALGGTWSYSTFNAWVDRQKQATKAPPRTSNPESVLFTGDMTSSYLSADVLSESEMHIYRDYSKLPSPEHQALGDNDRSFARKLHLILSDANLNRFMCWQSHGRAFRVCDYRLLEDSQILYRYFGIKRAAIFIQHLLSYGFKRLTQGEDRGCFYHECMLRGVPHVTKYITYAKDPHIKAPDPTNEPQLDHISKEYPLPEMAVGFQSKRFRRKARRKHLKLGHPHGVVMVHEVHSRDCRVVDHTYHDYSKVAVPEDYIGEKHDIHAMSFPEKLHHILSRQLCRSLMWWLPHGRSFMLGDFAQIEDANLLSKYFGNNRVSIFILQLQCHGFKRLTVGPDRGSFYHECMLRGLPHLTRYFPPPRDCRVLAPDPPNEPCFTAISGVFPLPDVCVTS